MTSDGQKSGEGVAAQTADDRTKLERGNAHLRRGCSEVARVNSSEMPYVVFMQS